MNTSPIGPTPNASTLDGRRLLLALELLARAVDKSTLAVLANIQAYAAGGGGGAGKGGGTGTGQPQQPPAPKKPPHERDRWKSQQQAKKAAANLKNYSAYMARKQAGQKLGKYDRKQNYAKPMGQRNRFTGGFSAKDRKFNAAGAKGAGLGSAIKGGGGLLGTLINVLMKLPGPLQLFVAAMDSASSGMGLLSKGFKLLAAVFAPILLPVAVILAAALLGMSDILWAKMMPALKGWFTFILTVGMHALKTFFDAVAFAADCMIKYANAQIDVFNVLASILNKTSIAGVTGVAKIPEMPHIPDPNEGRMPVWGGDQKAKDAADEKARREETDRATQRSTEILEEIKKENRAAGKPEYGEKNDAAAEAYKRAQAEKEKRLQERGVGAPSVDAENRIRKEEEDRATQRSTEILEEMKRNNKAAGLPEFGEKNNAAHEANRRAQAEKQQRLKDRGIDPGKPGGPGGFKMPNIKVLLGEVMKSLELDMGPKATIGDVPSARNTAQLAALNADPFEDRMTAMFAQTIDLLRQAVGELPDDPPNPVRP